MSDNLFKYGFINDNVLLVFGCDTKRKVTEDIVAQSGQKKLLASDVAEVIPDDISKEDSMAMAEDYINKWIKQQLLVQKAEENLSVDQKNLTRELEEYRNSLIIYRYKNELMKQRMDTTVTEDQITEYYQANTENFKLNQEYCKSHFYENTK